MNFLCLDIKRRKWTKLLLLLVLMVLLIFMQSEGGFKSFICTQPKMTSLPASLRPLPVIVQSQRKSEKNINWEQKKPENKINWEPKKPENELNRELKKPENKTNWEQKTPDNKLNSELKKPENKTNWKSVDKMGEPKPTMYPSIKLPTGIGCEQRNQGNITLSDQLLPLTALASPFRSGNTWLRHLLQIATGIGTSAVYCDGQLKAGGFPFECSHDQFRRTLVVKTHETAAPKDLSNTSILYPNYDRAVVVIRDPYTFIVANNHRSHLDITDEDNFFKPGWRKMQPFLLNWWSYFNNYWLVNFKGPVYPVLYSMLLNDTGRELRNILKFLRVEYTDADIQCALDNKEGNFHRKPYVWTRIRDVTELYNATFREKIDARIKYFKSVLNVKFRKQWVDETHEVPNNLTKCDSCNS